MVLLVIQLYFLAKNFYISVFFVSKSFKVTDIILLSFCFYFVWISFFFSRSRKKIFHSQVQATEHIS